MEESFDQFEAAVMLPWLWLGKMLEAHSEFLDALIWGDTPTSEMRDIICSKFS